MELHVLEEGKNKLVIEIEGLSHTICNVLVKELWNDDSVKTAAYKIDHPLIGIPKLIIETTGDKDPKKAVSDAIKRLQKDNEKFREDVKEIK